MVYRPANSLSNKRWKERNPLLVQQSMKRNTSSGWMGARRRKDKRKSNILDAIGCRNCALCGFQPRSLAQIDFHEIDNGKKIGKSPANVLMYKGSEEYYLGCLDNIVPLCKNCHALVHNIDFRDEMAGKLLEWKAICK